MKYLIYTALFFISAMACKQAATEESTTEQIPADNLAAIEAQVMAIHDEVMPKMQDITKMLATLRSYKEGASETPEGKIVYPRGLDDVMGELKLAEQGMWDWMKAYSDTKAELPADQLESFYKKELESVTKVKNDMLSSLEKGQAWLDENPK